MLRKFLMLLATLVASPFAAAQPGFDNSASNLMVVLRELSGANQEKEELIPVGKMKGKLPDGEEVEIDPGWFSYLGDMHIRFVFDTPTSMPDASADDLKRLGLTPQAALALAVANIKRVYGPPRLTPWEDLMEVAGKSPDLDSSYFLDRKLWAGLLKQHPDGIVAMVVKRGSLLYSPLTNTRAVDGMRKTVAALHASSGQLGVSSALYLFKNGQWSVFQDPIAR